MATFRESGKVHPPPVGFPDGKTNARSDPSGRFLSALRLG